VPLPFLLWYSLLMPSSPPDSIDTNSAPTIVWFRADLRLSDNPALDWACKRKAAIIPVFFWAPQEESIWAPGGASKWWLHYSLVSLQHSLALLGSKLIVRASTDSQLSLVKLIEETGANAVTWNRRYEPSIIERDAKIKEALVAERITVESFNGSLLCEPWKGVKADGKPYQVYTPFWRNQVARGFGTQPLPAATKILAPKSWPISEAISSLSLLPKKNKWDAGFNNWTPGEAGAHKRLSFLLSNVASSYAETRNLPAQRGTSMLSPHLHFGEISSNEVLHGIRAAFPGEPLLKDVETYVKELVWREFGYHLLFYFPHTPVKPLNKTFEKFPWIENADHLRAWQLGQTGYPIVDAGMRELWATGWMHNRVRMIVASFLVKHLLIKWQSGAAWFWDTLLDADLASNTMGWQWSAGSGADAAPYFRIFNPLLQGTKFDSQGEYVKRWCPELKNLNVKHIHAPWQASSLELQQAGITLGIDYPRPIVIHEEARLRALAAYKKLRG